MSSALVVGKSSKKKKRNNIQAKERDQKEEITNKDEPFEKKKSSKQKKRMKNYLDRIAMQHKRTEVLQQLSYLISLAIVHLLSSHALSEEQRNLLQSTKTLGQRETNKQKLRRLLFEERAGIVRQHQDTKISLLVPQSVNVTGTPEQPDQITVNVPLKPQVKLQVKSAEQKSLERRQKRLFFRNEEEETEEEKDRKRKKMDEQSKPTERETCEISTAHPVTHIQAIPVTSTDFSTPDTVLTAEKENKKVIPQMQHEETNEPLITPQQTKSHTPMAYFVQVQRLPEVDVQRHELPLVMEEQRIMEAIHYNDITIICGETGCGKTTQVPQFLYEAGYGSAGSDHPGRIGITEPRRVAAISMANRVAYELNLPFGQQVGYQIRYDAVLAPDAPIKFMTDGILLKEIQSDFFLTKYSAIIIDEAHERSMNTDILLGLLSKIVPLRAEFAKDATKTVGRLKLVIMSATLRVEDFVQNKILFPIPPPVINVDARQYPVTIHFNKKTPENYMNEAFKKVCKIHKRLPPGGVLVFLTGQQEIEGLCRKLKQKFPPKQAVVPQQQIIDEMDIKQADLSLEEGRDDEEEEDDEEADPSVGALHVLPLYSLLSTPLQLRVFESPPADSRLVVVATNVAETSLTIPGIKYVVDTGKVKELHYDKITGISQYKIDWTSQASANQRAGRAGRTAPGHCYRLYSSAVYANQFAKFSEPEIHLQPIEGVILQMKSMGIDNVSSFPFPTPPNADSMRAALRTLTYLGALDPDTQAITELGRTLSSFPVAPRYAKMLLLGKQGGCLSYVIAIVAALTVKDPLLRDVSEEHGDEDQAKQARRRLHEAHSTWMHDKSDVLSVLRAIGAFEYAGGTEEFCQEKFLYFKSMKEIRQLRQQLTNIFKSVDADSSITMNPKMSPPSKEQETLLRQIITAGLIDQVACLQREGSATWYAVLHSSDKVYIHPTSCLHGALPDFCVYREIAHTSKPYMKGLTVINPAWLPELGKPLCHFSKPLESPPPRYDSSVDKVKCFVRVNYGPHSWTLPLQDLEYSGPEKYHYFARFFLEGEICPKMKELQAWYVSNPIQITKGHSSNRINLLVQALRTADVDSKQKLLEQWKKEPKFLLSPVCLWIDKTNHKKCERMWPPM